MANQMSPFVSVSAKRMIAPLAEQGWDVEASHGDGVITRNGRRLQDVPWFQLTARRPRSARLVKARIKDWNRERAELEAASALLATIRRKASSR